MRDLKYEKRQAYGAAVCGLIWGVSAAVSVSAYDESAYGYSILAALGAFIFGNASLNMADEAFRRLKLCEEEIASQRQLMDDQYNRIIALETSLGECLSGGGLVPPASEFTPRIVK